MKRPSCMWKGQTDACEESTGGAGSPISRMPQKTKGGLWPSRQPTINKSSAAENKSSTTMNITSTALLYWYNELATRDNATREIYLHDFAKFTDFTHQTADELLEQRKQDLTNPDIKIQRRTESQLIKFISAKKTDGLAPATLQRYFASIRSFFEIHYYPLRMRRGDYPKGESLGVKVATKEAILKAIENKNNKNKIQIKAIILFLKDSGLRISDMRLYDYVDIREPLERGDKFISITRITKKQGTIAKAFIGTEAIQALKEYIDMRRKGTRRVPPETITDTSPLFRTWTAKIYRIPRSSLSSLVRTTFLRIAEANISAHSLRKYVQTNLEAAGVNVNWIDQIIGHKLINSRDAYSKPTDEQLREAYIKAYKFLQIYPDQYTTKPELLTQQTPNYEYRQSTQNEEYTVKTAKSFDEVTALIANGFRFATTIDGIHILKKRK